MAWIRLWEDRKLHPCHGKHTDSYVISPADGGKSVIVGCKHCKRKWLHPGGADLLLAWRCGYRSARQYIENASEQAAIAVLGMKP